MTQFIKPHITFPDTPDPIPSDRDPLIPTSLPWLVGIYLGLPLLITIVQYNPQTEASFERHFLTVMMVTLGIGGIIHGSYRWLMPRLLFRIRSRLGRLITHACCILVGVIIGILLIDPIISRLGLHSSSRDLLYRTIIPVSVTAVLVLVSSTYVRLERTRRLAKQQEQEARQAALIAQLKALQLRTNPHFLFNSLNTVASLIGSDRAAAKLTLDRLTGLFRYTIEGSQRQKVTLNEELSVIRDYLEIEQLRLGHRLRWEIDVAEKLTDLQLPPLVLQPLVENAVIHSIAPRREGGQVRINVRAEGREVILQVIDDGTGTSVRRGTGTSLNDLEQRLDLTYNGQAKVERRFDRKGHCVCIRLPKTFS